MARFRSRPPRLATRSPRFGKPEGQRRSVNWYATAEWQRLRAEVIRAATAEAAARGDVLRCLHSGVPLLGGAHAPDSPVVHHSIPHRGRRDLFFDAANLEVVAKAWHDSEGQRRDRAGGHG
jgi:5-methylcytosine-specific restriction protein A